MPKGLAAPIPEKGLVEVKTNSSKTNAPFLFGVSADRLMLVKVLGKVNCMLTAIPISQHKYYKTLLEHLSRALLEETEEEMSGPSDKTQVSSLIAHSSSLKSLFF